MSQVKLSSPYSRIAEIEFFHEAQNALPSHILSELALTIEKAGQNPDFQVIILKSGGNRTFCAGASFNELMAISNEAEGTRFFSGFAHVINAIRTCGKIVLGRVQGKAIGGGVGLASAVDYCFATNKAEIKLSELAVGIGPFVVGPAVERKVGLSAFSQLTLNAAQLYSAEWARQHGIYAQLFESEEDMDRALYAFAQELAGRNPEALSELKTIFWQGTEHWATLLFERAAVSGRLVLSDFTRKALARFAEAK